MTVRGAHTRMLNVVELLTIRDVAGMLRVSERTVERLIERGELPHVRPTPSTVRIHSDDLRAYVSGRRQEAVPAPRSAAPSATTRPGSTRSAGPARLSFLDELEAVER